MFVRKILRIVCESFEGEISKNLKNHTCSALIYVIPINKKKFINITWMVDKL